MPPRAPRQLCKNAFQAFWANLLLGYYYHYRMPYRALKKFSTTNCDYSPGTKSKRSKSKRLKGNGIKSYKGL